MPVLNLTLLAKKKKQSSKAKQIAFLLQWT